MSSDDHRLAALSGRWPAFRLSVLELLCLAAIVAIDVFLARRFQPLLTMKSGASGMSGFGFMLMFAAMSYGLYFALLLWGWLRHRNRIAITLLGERWWSLWLVVHLAALAGVFVMNRDKGAGLTFVLLLFDALFVFFIFRFVVLLPHGISLMGTIIVESYEDAWYIPHCRRLMLRLRGRGSAVYGFKVPEKDSQTIEGFLAGKVEFVEAPS